MIHDVLAPGTDRPLCILVTEIRKDAIRKAYVDPYEIEDSSVLLAQLLRPGAGRKKLSAAETREWFQAEMAPLLADHGVKYLAVTDAEAFKVIARTTKAEPYLGYVVQTDLAPVHVVYLPNYRQRLYDPAKIDAKIRVGIKALADHSTGCYREPGCAIIESASYPKTVEGIRDVLQDLHRHPALAVDIEAFSLKHYDAGIGTIAFAWDTGNGVAFPVDLLPPDGPELVPYGRIGIVRDMLREFFETYRGKLVWHNAGYDVTVKVFQLFMDHLLDNEGLLRGLEVLLGRDWDDTKLIAYLATNSTSGNDNGLKAQAQEFAGNYAVEVTDIMAVPLDDLLQYNLVDCLSTWYVHGKHNAALDKDDQRRIYEDLFKPALVDIIQMQLTGMPVSMPRVQEVRTILQAAADGALERIQGNPNVRGFVSILQDEWLQERRAHVAARNATILAKPDFTKAGKPSAKNLVQVGDPPEMAFNPNSGPQLIRLLFEVIGLPPEMVGKTKTGLPETGGDALQALVNHTDNPVVVELLEALVEYAAVDKILGTFIPALETAQQGPDGHWYLFGSFNLGGTVSGRLSSSNPNLQNLPANVSMKPSQALMERFGKDLRHFLDPDDPTRLLLGKLVKSCFVAPSGWFFVGIDFDSLEDKISALTTKDPNKLSVYTQGFDGHCLRAHAYWGDRMHDVSLAPEGVSCYRVKVGATDVYFHAEETVEYLGRVMKGSALYALLADPGV